MEVASYFNQTKIILGVIGITAYSIYFLNIIDTQTLLSFAVIPDAFIHCILS